MLMRGSKWVAGTPQDLPHVGQGDVWAFMQPSLEVGAAGQLGEAPRACGDGHLDARRQGGGPGRRVVAAETGEGVDQGTKRVLLGTPGRWTTAGASGLR